MARIALPELKEAIAQGRLVPDGTVLMPGGEATVTKMAIDPVWYLPGIAELVLLVQLLNDLH